MTKVQKLTLEMSEKRQKLNELLGLETLTDEQRAEMTALTARLQELEPELRAAIVAEGDGDPGRDGGEGTEFRALVGRCELGAIFEAVMEHRATEGAEREIQEHRGLGFNQVPLDLLTEHRAVTPAPANVGQNQAEIIPGVFPQSCAAFLGVDMPRVDVGEAVYPVLTTNATAHTPAENAAATETTGSFSADVLSPARLQASFFYSREDRARFRGMSEALRMNLSDALADGLDKQILAGDPNGLLHGAVLANHNVNAVTSFGDYIKELAYGRVDGTYAMSAMDLKVVMGSGTYAHAGEVYRNNSVDRTALDRLMEITGGVKVSAHVPAVDNKKQNALVRRGIRRDMVAPVWDGVTLIPDEVTKAANGQIVVTAVMLHAVKLLRADGFYKQQTQHA